MLYLPGIGATFLLDDFHILQPMAFSGGIKDIESLLAYLNSGGGGPLGRPISLMTFALNTQNWPADPKPFLVTNILIHSCNVLLVYFFVLTLCRNIGAGNHQPHWIALLSSVLWALHPFHASSVLYIVQRMTILSATFSLVTFIAFLELRSAILKHSIYRASSMILCLVIFSLMAVLTKESAVLIPIFLLIIEQLLRWSKAPSSKLIENLYYVLLMPMALIIAAYPLWMALSDLYFYFSTGQAPMHGRTYTMWERLLTQGRVLIEYILCILLPKMQSAGVFHDQYQISKGLFSPITTSVAWVMHLIAIAIALRLRKSNPLVSFGIIWFYVGHIIESTVIMLELKFEHRNYLPSLGLIIAVTSIINNTAKSPRTKMFVIGGSSVILSTLLWLSTSLWGNPHKASLVWAHENSNSPRALEEAARRSIIYAGDILAAKKYIKDMIRISPYAVNELKYILAFCETHDGLDPKWADYANRIQKDPRDWSLVKVIDDLLKSRINGHCDLVSYDALILLIDGFRKNKLYWDDPSSKLSEKTAYEAAAFFRDDEKVQHMEYAIDLEKSYLWQTTIRAGILATYGYLDLAAERLENAIFLAKKGKSYANSRSLEDAAEVLAIIERERSMQ